MSTATNGTIVVHGGAGSLGRPVVRQLLEDGFTVRVISRHPAGRVFPAGVTAVAADLGDADSLAAAYRGADGVYLQLPLEFDPVTAPAQAGNALTALARADVGRVVFNTGLGLTNHLVGSPFVDARATLVQRLGEAVPNVTVTGPEQAYIDNFATPFSRAAVRQGRAEYPLPEAAMVAWVASADIARVVARAFLSDTPPAVRIVRGPAYLNGSALAEALAAAVGRTVTWATITPERYRELLTDVIGPAAAAGIADSYAHPAPPGPPLPDDQVTVGPTDVTTWARTVDWT
jgi:uncharacterized protein YbjT (DUF2867 family)